MPPAVHGNSIDTFTAVPHGFGPTALAVHVEDRVPTPHGVRELFGHRAGDHGCTRLTVTVPVDIAGPIAPRPCRP